MAKPDYSEMYRDPSGGTLYQGAFSSAKNWEFLFSKGITHIVNCTPLPNVFEKHSPPINYCNATLYDTPTDNLLKYLNKIFAFVDAALATGKNNVLVHCAAGVSRSAAVTTAYIMHKKQWTYNQALCFVTSHRPAADPSVYEKQLLKLEEKLKAERNYW